MAKRIYGDEFGFFTRAVHTGNDVDGETGTIKRPITMANSYELPFNAWLIMRGAVTLPLRMRQHNENALKVAQWLEKQKNVSFVSYPGLESDKGHKIAKLQMTNGFGGVLSFGLKADHDTHNKFVQNLRLITSAVSLGHDESLIVFLGENDERQYLYPEEFHNGFFRFSVGIEDTEDIIEDLHQALEKVGLL